MKYIYNFIPTKRKVARDVSVRRREKRNVKKLIRSYFSLSILEDEQTVR